MIVNEYVFEILQREHEAQLAVELERRRRQLERAAETESPSRERARPVHLGHARRSASRHAH